MLSRWRPLRLPAAIGRYQIVGLLATGGMAEVLLGKLIGPAGFERPVVVKRVLPHLAREAEFREMFLDEARLVAGLRHPNVVQVHELGQVEDELFLVMEYLAGESVSALLRRMASAGERLPPALAAHVVAEAAAGLHAAHELKDDEGAALGVVHRDVSPQNVVITYDGAVKVLDFGIAKAAHRSTSTNTGQLKGKHAYMSPEQCRADPVDRRTDVFALGILLWEMLVQKRLFARPTELATLRAILDEPVLPPSAAGREVPPELDAIAMRALARDPEARYPTASEMRRDLVRAAASLDAGNLFEEKLATSMRQLFTDRISEKEDMLRRVKSGAAISRLPGVEPTPATLASHDLAVPRPSRGGRARLLVAVLLLAAVGGGAWWALRGLDGGAGDGDGAPPAAAVPSSVPGSPPAPAPVPPPPPAPPPPVAVPPGARVSIRVETDPPGALVRLAGEDRGTTPLDLQLERSEAPVDLQIARDGYDTHREQLTPDVDQRLRISLHRDPRVRRPPRDRGGFFRFE